MTQALNPSVPRQSIAIGPRFYKFPSRVAKGDTRKISSPTRATTLEESRTDLRITKDDSEERCDLVMNLITSIEIAQKNDVTQSTLLWLLRCSGAADCA